MVDSTCVPNDHADSAQSHISTMTAEERSVLAWERIADELTLLNQSLEQFLEARVAACPAIPEAAFKGDERTVDVADSGPSAENPAKDPDVEHSIVECFAVGGYRYTNLQHAIEQARRSRAAAMDVGGAGSL